MEYICFYNYFSQLSLKNNKTLINNLEKAAKKLLEYLIKVPKKSIKAENTCMAYYNTNLFTSTYKLSFTFHIQAGPLIKYLNKKK
jgi:hypothetical protein